MDTIKRLADELPYRQFLKEGVVDLRDDGILKGYWLEGPSPDSCDAAHLLARAEQLGKSPVHLRTGDAIQVVFDRQPAPLPPDLHYARPAAAMVMQEIRDRFAAEEHWVTPTRLYLSHQFEKPIKNMTRTFLLGGGNEPQRLSDHNLLRAHALGRFQSLEDSIKGAVAGLNPMSNVDMFRDLHHLVTYNDYPVALPAPHVRLNKVIASEWQVNGERPMMGDWHLRPIVITAYPSQTLPQTLSILLQHPGYLTLSVRFRCLSPYDAQKKLEKEKPFWSQTAIGDFIEIIKSFFGAKKENSQHAFDQIQEIQEAINASKDGTSFGTVGCIAIVRDHDPREAEARANNLTGVLQGKGIMCRIETVGAAKAIRSTWPGYLLVKADEHEANRLRIPLTGFNFWDVAMPAKYWQGTPYIQSTMYPPNTPSPLALGGTAGEPFYFPTHVGRVAHLLGIGSTDSGKSTLAAVLACGIQSIPNSHLTWLDLGHSSFVLAHLLGAEYHDVGDPDSTPLCPLALLDRPTGLQYLMGWFERLFFRRKGFELDESGSKDLRNALMDVRMRKNYPASDGRSGRHLHDLYAALPSGRAADDQRTRMRAIVKELAEDYGYIFGGEPTDATNNRITVYELSNLDTAPKYISTPAKELILYNTMAALSGKPGWVFWDEFWDAIGDEVSSAWFFRAIRTMRRMNCGFVGLTQSSVEITDSPYCNLLLGNMPGKLFFPDHSADTPIVSASLARLGLNPHEVGRIAGAHTGEFFYKSRLGSRLASAWLDPIGQAICASTSIQSVEAMQELLKQCKPENLLDEWLAKCGIGKSETMEAA